MLKAVGITPRVGLGSHRQPTRCATRRAFHPTEVFPTRFPPSYVRDLILHIAHVRLLDRTTLVLDDETRRFGEIVRYVTN